MSSSSEGAKVSKKSLKKTKISRKRSGFTILEVMLVLALTGMLMLGVLGGTFSSIRTQRYNDSVRSFAEFLRTVYSEVISPESLGAGTSSNYAVLGKAIVFGLDNGGSNGSVPASNAYTVTVVGNATIPDTAQDTFIKELAAAEAQFYCGQTINSENHPSSVSHYELPWQAELRYPNLEDFFGKAVSIKDDFKGTVIIARSPTSGAVHTIFTTETYNLIDECRGTESNSDSNSGASKKFQDDLDTFANSPGTSLVKFGIGEVSFCVESENSTLMREVRIAADGRNTTAINIINTDVLEDGERNNCR